MDDVARGGRLGRLASWNAVRSAFIGVLGFATLGTVVMVVLAATNAIEPVLAAVVVVALVLLTSQAAVAVLLTRQVLASRRAAARAQRRLRAQLAARRRSARRAARLLREAKAHSATHGAAVNQVQQGVAGLDSMVFDIEQTATYLRNALEAEFPRLNLAAEPQPNLHQKIDRLQVAFDRFASTHRVPEYDVRILHQVEAMLELRDVVPRDETMPLSGGWVATPTTLLEYVNLLRDTKPSLVVECGSGASSLWCGYTLRALGAGRCIALEHDPVFHEISVAAVRRHGLQDWVEVRLAPLDQTPSAGGPPWYAASSYQDLTGIDVVLVDGPPGATAPGVRGVAADALLPRCAPGVHFLLDDSNREDERAVVEEWTTRHGMRVVRSSKDAKGWTLLQAAAATAGL